MTSIAARPAWLNEYQANKRYRPIDEILAMPRVRILRALTHFDEISGEDLNLALEVHDERLANNYTNTLSRLVREGHVERRAVFTTRGRRPNRQSRVRRGSLSPQDTRYRITERGRRELRDQLARAIVGDLDVAVQP